MSNNEYTGNFATDYVTATTHHQIDKVTYIVISRPSERAIVTIKDKINGLIVKEIRKLANEITMLAGAGA